MNEEESLERLKEKVESSFHNVTVMLNKCIQVSRPYRYEHNHFMLVEAIAEYLVQLEKYKNYKEEVENVF